MDDLQFYLPLRSSGSDAPQSQFYCNADAKRCSYEDLLRLNRDKADKECVVFRAVCLTLLGFGALVSKVEAAVLQNCLINSRKQQIVESFCINLSTLKERSSWFWWNGRTNKTAAQNRWCSGCEQFFLFPFFIIIIYIKFFFWVPASSWVGVEKTDWAPSSSFITDRCLYGASCVFVGQAGYRLLISTYFNRSSLIYAAASSQSLPVPL